MAAIVKFLKIWFPLVAYSVIILYVCSIPGARAAGLIRINDKIAHIILFAPFGFILTHGIHRHSARSWSRGSKLVLAGFVSLIYGLFSEWIQLSVAGRTFSYADAVADLTGGVLGGIIYLSLTATEE